MVYINVMKNKKNKEILVFVDADDATLETLLKDSRYPVMAYVFGTMSDVARQYGIKTIQSSELGTTFSAPKSRMQIFIEKLHFSGVKYEEID